VFNTKQGLKLGGLGRISPEVLFAGALGVVIVASLILTVYAAFSGGSGAVGEPLDFTDSTFTFQCLECPHQFEASTDQVLTHTSPLLLREHASILDCPECGTKNSCLMTQPCPKCGHEYIWPQTLSFYSSLQQGGGQALPTENICPGCGVDVDEFYRARRKRQRP